jgi:hypothetical protein
LFNNDVCGFAVTLLPTTSSIEKVGNKALLGIGNHRIGLKLFRQTKANRRFSISAFPLKIFRISPTVRDFLTVLCLAQTRGASVTLPDNADLDRQHLNGLDINSDFNAGQTASAYSV